MANHVDSEGVVTLMIIAFVALPVAGVGSLFGRTREALWAGYVLALIFLANLPTIQ
jgi:hypothetical protein